jgi:hypothetical protein
MQKTNLMLLTLLTLAAAVPALAQAPDPQKFYKLDFVVKEVEAGKVINARAYSTLLAVQVQGAENYTATIRTGGRTPVTDSKGAMTYIDTGVNLDCKSLRETQGEVSLFVSSDISSLLQEQGLPAPVIRQNRWAANVSVPLRKPTIIFSSDDTSSKRQMQLELTASPVK